MKRNLILTLVLVLLLALGATAAFATDPVFRAENPSCADLGYSLFFKIDTNPANGVYNGGTITISNANGTYFDWSSTFGIDIVIVKGGPNANLYYYDEAFGDTGLHAPINNDTPYDLSHVEFCYDVDPQSALQVSKTANTSFDRTWTWTIDKSVSPAILDMFRGDTGSVEYSVAVQKNGPDDSNFVISGDIYITNPATNTMSAHVTSVVEGLLGASVTCDTALPTDLAPGATLHCSYSASVGSKDAGNNHVDVTTTGPVGGGSADMGYIFGAPTTETNASINVDDSNGGSWSFGDSGNVKYGDSFTCDGDEGPHNNTATIRDTTIFDGASVQVNCYELTVSKTANTSFDRTWTWTIDKSADTDSVTLLKGETDDIIYTVMVDASSLDSNWMVTGTITVSNPAPIAAVLSGVTDSLPGAVVECGGVTQILPGRDLVCTYTASSDGSAGFNTATATLTNGTGFVSDPVAYSFDTPNKIDECVDVTDTLGGPLGTVCADDDAVTLPHTFASYPYTVGPFDTCGGQPSVDNTATFVTNDTSATGSDSVSIPVTVACYWCSPGFWAQHLDVADNYVDLTTPYSEISNGVALKKGSPADPTIADVLASPQTYGGPAFNQVANYISAEAFGLDAGTQSSGEYCPLDAHGDYNSLWQG